LQDRFVLAPDVEIATEIDPRTVTPDMVRTLAARGVKRVSLGVQTFDEVVQRAIRRIQPFAEVRRVVEWLREAGIDAINFDLLYGLPYQTVENVLGTVERALTLSPARVALFGYAHVPWMKKHQALLPVDVLPGPAERLAQYETASRNGRGRMTTLRHPSSPGS
jgi:oxygen-independent coproporphyrinogen III oxidase